MSRQLKTPPLPRKALQWYREREDYFLVLGTTLFLVAHVLGPRLGFVYKSGWAAHLVIATLSLGLLLSLARLGWLDKVLGIDLATRVWLVIGLGDLKLGNRAEADRAFARAERYRMRFRTMTCAALPLLLRFFGLGLLLRTIGVWMLAQGHPQRATKVLFAAVWVYRFSSARWHTELDILELFLLALLALEDRKPLYLGHADPVPGIYTRVRELKTRIAIRSLLATIARAHQAYAAHLNGHTETALRSLARLESRLERFPLRHAQVVISTVYAEILLSAKPELAEEHALHCLASLRELVDIERPLFIPKLTLPSQTAAQVFEPLRALAMSIGPQLGWTLWLLLALLYADEGRLDDAERCCRQAISNLEAVRPASLVSNYGLPYEFLLRLILKKHTINSTPFTISDICEAFAYVERARATTTIQALASATNHTVNGHPSVDVSELQQILWPGGALVEYYLAPDFLLAFRITPAAPPKLCYLEHAQVTELLQAATLYESIFQQTADRVHGREPPSQTTGTLHEVCCKLYDLLLRPLEIDWHTVTDLVVVPHGPLHNVVFSTLQDGDSYVIQRATITHAPSAALWAWVRKHRSARPQRLTYLGAGNPHPGNPDNGYWNEAGEYPPLPDAEGVVLATARLFDPAFDTEECRRQGRFSTEGACVLLRHTATWDHLKTLSTHYTVLDIEGHGEFDSGRPLRSFIVLPDEHKKGSVRRITAETIVKELKLSDQCALVVVATCHGSQARVAPGDDPLGLAYAFLACGAPTVLSYRWPLVDSAAKSLLQEFFRAWIVNGEAPALALRRAQEAMLSTDAVLGYGLPSLNNPYFWAWMLIGDGGTGEATKGVV